MFDEVEEDEYIDDSEVTEQELQAFEPVTLRSPPRRSSSRAGSGISGSEQKVSRSGTRRPEMKKIRIKVHDKDDTRYIMMATSPNVSGKSGIDFGDFEARVREKFLVKGVLKMKIKEDDSGDLITMGDQDDLDVLMHSVRQGCRRERSDMGKMEVWISY